MRPVKTPLPPRVPAWLLILSSLTPAFHLSTASFNVYPVNYQHAVSRTVPPADTLDSLAVRAAAGEMECAALVVRAKQAVGRLEVALTDFTNSASGRRLPADSIELRELEFVFTDSTHTRELPLRLWKRSPSALAPGQNRQFWLTFPAMSPADSGRFSGTIIVRGQGAACSLSVSLTVHPFSLLPFDGFSCGAFIGSLAAINRRTALDMKAHGIDAVQFFLGRGEPYPGIFKSDTFPTIMNEGGHLKVHMHSADSMLAYMREAGLKGPVVFSTGNDSKGHLERDICDAFPQFKLDTTYNLDGKTRIIGPTDNPIFDTLMVSAVRQWKERIEALGFEMVLIIYDEPTERMMAALADRYALYKAAFPGLRCYGVTMDALSFARQVAPYSEILVANGSFLSIANFARTGGKEFWFYGGAPAADEAGMVRGNDGLRYWKYGPGATFFWAYNYYSTDPYVDYDAGGAESQKAVVFPACSLSNWEPVGTPAWEGIREAHDDWAYVKTLEKLLTGATGATAATARNRLLSLKTRIADNAFYSAAASDYRPLDSIRTVCVDWIIAIQREEPGIWARIGIEQAVAAEPSSAPLAAAPNPFNPVLSVSYTLPRRERVVVGILDIGGRRVCTLKNDVEAAGFHQACWNGKNAVGGLYVVFAAYGGRTVSKKVLLIK